MQGQDLIDLSAVDADVNAVGVQHFTLIGAGAFTNTAGEMRYSQIDNPTGSDFTFISMDVNGDGVVDAQITLVGLVNLQTSDFILG